MPALINISTIGHVITTLSFIGVALYVFLRQKDLVPIWIKWGNLSTSVRNN
jgi:hypothetical protein